jgi:hypothetical protein
MTMSRLQRELGKALCDRAGLDPNRVPREYNIQFINKREVMVTLQVMTIITVDEFADIRAVAQERAAALDARERQATNFGAEAPKKGPVG